MIDLEPFFKYLEHSDRHELADFLRVKTAAYFKTFNHGDFEKWKAALEALPQASPSLTELNEDTVLIGKPEDCLTDEIETLRQSLKVLHPWRKGPFNFFGVQVETEWRSDFKWNRLRQHIQPLEGRTVLDIGCGNGYHLWRMLGAGAKAAVGIDPTFLYVMQFQAAQFYFHNYAASVLPLKIEDFEGAKETFDTVFSMGIFYHRKSPFDHLMQLKDLLRNGGELVLETLVIKGHEGEIIVPEDRYAQMPNVWFIPSCPSLEGWLKKVGFKNVQLINTMKTTEDEQRRTDWMTFESLADGLNPEDPEQTVEGYPAPRRAIFLATK